MKIRTKRQHQKALDRIFELMAAGSEDEKELDALASAVYAYEEWRLQRLTPLQWLFCLSMVFVGMGFVFIKSEITGAEDSILECIRSMARLASLIVFGRML